MRPRLETRLAGLLVLATLLAFGGVLWNGFLNFDDGIYILDNPRVRAGLSWEGARWAFGSTDHASFYHPLTWLSHMLDVELYGVEGRVLGLPAAGWHHLTSLLLHVGSALFLFAFLRAATGATWRSFLVAALFALHPLHVESVVWAAERKDVLSTFLGFGCLLAYARYAERPGAARYLLVLALLALGLLAKPMLVTWPFLLLLLDWWPLGRARPVGPEAARADAPAPAARPGRLVLEKLPLFALVAVVSVMSYAAQQDAAMHLMERLPLGTRLENALVSTLLYVGDTLWPAGLAPHYPYRPLPAPLVALAAAFALCLSVAALFGARRRPWLAVGWFWFVGTLVPVSGIVQVGLHARADRYTYIPLVGLFLALVWAAGELAARRPRLRRALGAAGGLALVACALLTARQVRLWRDTVTLFEHTLAVTDDNGWAHRILGTALAAEGRHAEALGQYEAALGAWPGDPIAHANRAHSLAALGRSPEALAAAREAARLDPTSASLQSKLGTHLAREGALPESVAAFERALALDPALLEAHVNLGKSLALLGRMDEAAERFEAATRLAPRSVEAWNNLAAARAQTGRLSDAVPAAEEAHRLAVDQGYPPEVVEQLARRAAGYRAAR